MRSRLLTGALVATIGFLLATNPVVVEAAGQITGGQIKNGTITSQDIKNGQVKSSDVKNRSLRATDLARGAVPVEVKAVRRLAGQPSANLAATITPAFYGPTTTVTVDADDVVVASVSGVVEAFATGDDYSSGVCARPVGSSAAPTPIGGPPSMSEDLDALAGQNVLSSDATAVLGAGTYTIGWCGRLIGGTVILRAVSGWVQVHSGSTGPL